MKKLLLSIAVLMFASIASEAQSSSSIAYRVRTVTTLPATCNNIIPVDFAVLRSGGVNTLYVCGDTANTWKAVGSGLSNPMTTAGDIIVGGTAGAVTRFAIGSANQVLGVNNAGTAQEYKTITAGTNVTVTHGANSITIAATGGTADCETTATDAATVTMAIGTCKQQFLTIAASRILGAPTGLAAGQTITLRLVHGASSTTLTYNAVFKFPGGIAPTLTATNGATDILTFYSDGTNVLLKGLATDVK